MSNRMQAAFDDGYRRSMLDAARRDLEFYGSPEARAKPLAAWVLLPYGYTHGQLRQVLAVSDQADISAEDAALVHATNVAVLKKRVASLTLYVQKDETPHVAH